MNFKVRIPPINRKLQIGIVLLIVKTFISVSGLVPVVDAVDTFLSVIGSIFFALVIFESRYSVRTLMIYAVVVLLGFYTAIRIGNVSIFITIITCLAIREENFNNVIRFMYKCELFLLVLNVVFAFVLNLFGLYSIYTSIDGTLRCNFGFAHPNAFSILLFNVIMMWTWINFSNLKYKNVSAIFLIEFVAFFFSRTRTAFITSIVFCILTAISLYVRDQNKPFKVVASLIVPVMSLATYVMVTLYMKSNLIAFAVNEVFSSRVKLAAYVLDRFGVSVFGRTIDNFSMIWDSYWQMNKFTFDSIYIYFMVNVGIIWLVLICILFWKLAHKGDKKICIYIIMWALYGVTEVHGINCYLCFPILMVIMLAQRKKQELEND